MGARTLVVLAGLLACASLVSAVDTQGLAASFFDMLNGHSDGSQVLAGNVEFVDEVNMPGKPAIGLKAVQSLVAQYRSAFADLHCSCGLHCVVGPLSKDGTFVFSVECTGTHTGSLNGMKPIAHDKIDAYFVNRATLGKSGKITKVQAMHGNFLLNEIGYLNHIMINTLELGERFMAFWNHDHDDVSYLAPDFKMIDHMNLPGSAPESTVVGPDALIQMRAMYKKAFPDMHFTNIDATPLQGDSFILTWTFAGTHQGELMGYAPTGTTVKDYDGACIMKLVGGKIAEQRVIHSKYLLRVLGLLPELPPQDREL